MGNSDCLQEEEFLRDTCGRKRGLMDKPEAVTEPSLVWCSRVVCVWGGGERGENVDILLISVGHSYLGFVRIGVKKKIDSSISLSHVGNSDRLQEEQFLSYIYIYGSKRGLMVKPEAVMWSSLV